MSEYEIFLKPSAMRDLDNMRQFDVKAICDVMEECLANEPAKEGKSRIKRLRGISDPDYRLRAGAYRVFYSIEESRGRVNVLRVLHKDETQQYYQELKR